jgi:uncharacterized protein YjbI with pentapeptide repeats
MSATIGMEATQFGEMKTTTRRLSSQVSLPQLALAFVLLVLVVSSTFAQNRDGEAQHNEKVWTWKNSDGEVKTAADLEAILDQHSLWIESANKQGSPANLSGASLQEAELSDAELDGANLQNANLSDAKLYGAHLRGANLREANLSGAILQEADLSNAPTASNGEGHPTRLEHANLSGAKLFMANLTYAQLDEANLSGAHLDEANLSGASLYEADLTGAILVDANLTYAQLYNAKLDNAIFLGAILNGTNYEPKSNPDVSGIAYARNLESMTYWSDNSSPLSQLRKEFQDNGFREAERKISYVLNRRRAQLATPIERWFKTIAFDWTCQYGMSPGRALRIWLTLFLICCVIYATFIHLPGKSGLYRTDKTQKDEWPDEQIVPRQILRHPRWLIPPRFVARESRVVYWAVFFSLMSAFNIGFREIDFGRWLRLLPRTEFDLKAKGWMRTVAGFQSLISVYLIALWVLSYFGRPFE